MTEDFKSRVLTTEESRVLAKEAALWDLITDFLNSPLVKNIITMLSFAGASPKVTTAIRLLEEAADEAKGKKNKEKKKKKSRILRAMRVSQGLEDPNERLWEEHRKTQQYREDK